jgi:predicted CXXCH cytochrome family protein
MAATVGVVILAAGFVRHGFSLGPPEPGSPGRLDMAAWGKDHVGKPIPQYMTGDECLFCHRKDAAATWADNRHNLTIRAIDPKSPALSALVKSPDLAKFGEEVTHVLGKDRRQRFLRTAREYGKLDLLSVAWSPGDGANGKLIHEAEPHWQRQTFGTSCAGCHATAVNPKTHAFSALSLDCYACHGDVPFEHTEKPALVYLGKQRKDAARVVTSICAQCHVRTGRSRSSGLPYPNNFVAGDNLFRDFQVDLSPGAIRQENPADAHVLANVRDVVILGKEDVNCLSCHDVHGQSSKKHHRVAETDYCLHCHNAGGSKKDRKPYEVHSKLCGY